MDNINEVYAESNMAHAFSKRDYIPDNYISIFKLSCGYCHKYLEDNNYNYRDTTHDVWQ